MPRTVLITGITGFIGSHLARFLVQQAGGNVAVYGTHRQTSSLDKLNDIIDQVRLIPCDLLAPVTTRQMLEQIRPEIVFHLASNSSVKESWQRPEKYVSHNPAMQLNLFEGIRSAGLDPVIQVVLSSEEFGNVAPGDLPVRENHRQSPRSPYALGKVSQDFMAQLYYHTYNLKVIRMITFNMEGPGRNDSFAINNFAKQLVQIEMGMAPPVIRVGNLSARRDWTDVRDGVRAYWQAIEHCRIGEAYVLASGTPRSLENILHTLIELSNLDPQSVEVVVDSRELRPTDLEVLYGSSEKLTRETGWTPQIAFEQTLRDILAYWREQLSQHGSSAAGSLPSGALRTNL